MKKIILFLSCYLVGIGHALACEVCKRQQPEVLQDVTHGMGPQGTIDYIITWGATIIVVVTLVLSIKMLVYPNERQSNHAKHIPLLNNDK